MDKTSKALISAAKAFAKKKNGGVSARIREMLDKVKPGIAILVQERMALTDIQQFCKEQGVKVGITAVRQYCYDNFNYPPRKKTGSRDES